MTLASIVTVSRAAAPIAVMGAVVAGLLFAGSPSHAASDSVTIRISYSTTIDRARPAPHNGIVTSHSLTVILSGLKNVEEKNDSQSGRSTRQSSKLHVLGGRDKEGGGIWHVLGPKQLVRRIEYPQNWSIMTVTVTGEQSCQVTIQHVLKPGYREFTLKRFVSREIAYYSRVTVTSSSCQIA
jgi:hypothetical protein